MALHLKAAEYRPIARELWEDFAAEFTRQHQGWRATLAEVETDLLETHPLTAYAASILIADEEPVTEVVLSSERDASSSIRLGVDTHQRVEDVAGVYLHCTEEGEHRGLRIDTSDNQSVLLEFSDSGTQASG